MRLELGMGIRMKKKAVARWGVLLIDISGRALLMKKLELLLILAGCLNYHGRL